MRAFVKAVQIARFIPVVEEDRRQSLYIDVISEARRSSLRRISATVLAKARELTAGVPSSMHAIVHERKRYSLYELRENNMLVNRGLVRHRVTKEIPAPPPVITSRHPRSSVLDPSSSFRAGWDLVLIGLVLYTAIAVPVEIAFATTDVVDVLFVLNRVIDTFFFLDCCVNFMTPYMDIASNQLVDDPRSIVLHYVQGWFALDIVSIVPYDLISWAMTTSSAFTLNQTQNVKALQIMRLLRILKLARVFRASRILQRWKAVLGFPVAMTQLGKYAFVMIILAHWMACLWGYVPQYQDDVRNWEVVYQVNGSSPSTLYIASLYWSVMTIGTIGYGDVPMVTNLEKLVAILCITTGCATYSFIVGSVCGLVSSLDESSNEFNQQMDHLNTYMEREDIPPVMVFRLREYFLHRRDLMLHRHFSRVINTLSPGLEGELCVFTAGEWVEKIPFFMGGPPGEHVRFVTAISRRIEAELYPPQELIVRAGEISGKMFIISKGLVAQRGRILHQGQIFGQHMLLDKIDSLTIYDARTLTYVDAYSFSRCDLDEILRSHHYPNKCKTIRKATVLLALNRRLRSVYVELLAIRAFQKLTPVEETAWLRHQLLGHRNESRAIHSLRASIELMTTATTVMEAMLKLDASMAKVEEVSVALRLLSTAKALATDALKQS